MSAYLRTFVCRSPKLWEFLHLSFDGNYCPRNYFTDQRKFPLIELKDFQLKDLLIMSPSHNFTGSYFADVQYSETAQQKL